MCMLYSDFQTSISIFGGIKRIFQHTINWMKYSFETVISPLMLLSRGIMAIQWLGRSIKIISRRSFALKNTLSDPGDWKIDFWEDENAYRLVRRAHSFVTFLRTMSILWNSFVKFVWAGNILQNTRFLLYLDKRIVHFHSICLQKHDFCWGNRTL